MLTKEKIIESINKLDNPYLLNEISNLLEVENQDIKTLSVNEVQEKLLKISLEQIENGNILTEKEANGDIENWFRQQSHEEDSLD